MTRHIRTVTASVFVATLATGALWPAELSADQRGRSGSHSSGRTVVVASPRYYYRPYYGYYGGFYPGFYGSAFWGSPYWSGYGWGPYGQYPYPPYYGYRVYDNTGAARLQVTPRNAQVYIDGYFVGVVDDFDGYMQRLNIDAGEHELQLFLQGYQPFSQKVLFSRGSTLKITHAMQPLAPGESAGAPPKPDPAMQTRTVERAPEYQGPPPPQQSRPSEYGSLLLQVRPSDATILVDGEAWSAPEGQDQFVIELSEGGHRIEVRKDGFQTYAANVRVRRGETIRLNVSLTTGGLARGN